MAFWNYDRTQALVDGRVKVEGCELDIELLRPEITFCAQDFARHAARRPARGAADQVRLAVNLKTAKALGIAVPLPLSGRADEAASLFLSPCLAAPTR